MKVLFLLSYTVLSFLTINPLKNKSFGNLKGYPASSHSIVKIKAFKILEKKCNVCHVKKNRRKIFTLDNINLFGSEIYTQVFVKKRMPKGNKIELTKSEYIALKNWLNTLNIK